MAYWKAFDFTSKLMPVKVEKKVLTRRNSETCQINGRKEKELAFENEEGRVWKIVKPMFSTPSRLNHREIYIKTSQRDTKWYNIITCTQYKCEVTYLPFEASNLIKLIKVL